MLLQFQQITQELDSVAENIRRLEESHIETLQENVEADTEEIDAEIRTSKQDFEKLEQTINSFRIVIPVNQIASANIFDTKVHSMYFLPAPENEE